MYDRIKTLIGLALFLILFCDSTSSECTQLGPCVCRLSDGFYYNLTSLADKETLADKKINLTAYFHPCRDVPISIGDNKSNPCSNGTSLCVHNATGNEIINLGSINDTQMKLPNSNSKFPVFEIHHNNITSIINILCMNGDGNAMFKIQDIFQKERKYHFTLASPHACKKEPQYRGISIGSVLVILFITFTLIYLIGGAIILRALRGATGWEMLPNHEFWCELPSLVRDGVVFTFNCCRANSYERI